MAERKRMAEARWTASLIVLVLAVMPAAAGDGDPLIVTAKKAVTAA